jgi:hypothetical protein
VHSLTNIIKWCKSIVAVNKPTSYQHTAVILLDVLCESYIVSIEIIRINLVETFYFANESADVLTANIVVDLDSKRN